MSLLKSFNKTNFDLESDLPYGGPMGDPSAPFYQEDVPKSTYLDKNPIAGWGKLADSFKETNYDLESNLPAGGPINVPNTSLHTGDFNTIGGFSMNDLPNSTYLDKNPIMGEGRLNSDAQFKSTNFDLEDSLPAGGPIHWPDQLLYNKNQTVRGEYKGFTPIFNPTTTFLSQFPIHGPKSSRLTTEPYGVGNIYAETNWDMENPQPNSGAPVNVPITNGRGSKWGVTEGYIQKWGPGENSGYLDQDFTKYPYQPITDE